jgi:hypothetical protein
MVASKIASFDNFIEAHSFEFQPLLHMPAGKRRPAPRRDASAREKD